MPTSQRPAPADRCFSSSAVDELIAEIDEVYGTDSELAWVFGNCFPNTLDTTVQFGERHGQPDSFVITGDIDAMWLRDSINQVWPYLLLANDDPALQELLHGLIRRQTWCVLLDPYANAFYRDADRRSGHADDQTPMRPEVHERKWEIDSLCAVVRLAHGYWQRTGDTSPFDGDWRQAMRRILQTFREQQRRDGPGPYQFRRTTASPLDTLIGNDLAIGHPVRPGGLIASAFRPSDDACTFPFLVPANCFAALACDWLAELADAGWLNSRDGIDARALAADIRQGLAEQAIGSHGGQDEVWCYECDGFGNRYYIDDANIPSLLSLPYLGFCPIDDARYRRTRAWVLSEANPYYAVGSAARGVGGPHRDPDWIWPMALIMQALTTEDEDEIADCLQMLLRSHADTGFMHETFHKNDPRRFTRPWFAWANTLFGELIVNLHRDRPEFLRQVATDAG